MKQKPFYAIKPPWGWDDDYPAHESLGASEEQSWERFCRPALKKEAFEEEGFHPVPVRVIGPDAEGVMQAVEIIELRSETLSRQRRVEIESDIYP